MTSTSSPATVAPAASASAGLRERKKAKTRALIREVAMGLFEERGFAATTVEQIAEAAEVSPSTFFRYFPAKEDVVLADDWDPLLIAAIRAQPAELAPIDALLGGVKTFAAGLSEEDWAAERRRQKLFGEFPELRARYLQQLTSSVDMLAAVLAERAGKPAGDLTSRVLAGALIGVSLAVLPAELVGSTAADLDRYAEALMLLKQSLGS
jgi:AcrR family transcriptional regulator